MGHPSLRATARTSDPFEDAPALVDLDKLTATAAGTLELVAPAELGPACRCGNVTARGHGAIGGRAGYTCDQVLEIRARVDRYAARASWPGRVLDGGATFVTAALATIGAGGIAGGLAAWLGWL